MSSSPYFAGFWAVNSTAFTPYASAASRVDSFRNAKAGTTVERTRSNPASSNSANASPSGRAPPIQLAQSFGSLTIDCDNCLALTMSAMDTRPPGLSTRYSSPIRQRNVFHRARAAFHRAARERGMRFGLSAHVGVEIHADHAAGWPDLPARDDAVQSRAAPEIEYRFTGSQPAAQVRVANAGERRHRAGRCPLEPVALVAEHLGGLPAMEEVELLLGMVRDLLVHPQHLALDHALERGLLDGLLRREIAHRLPAGFGVRGSSAAFT